VLVLEAAVVHEVRQELEASIVLACVEPDAQR